MTLLIAAGFAAIAFTLRGPGGQTYSATFVDARGLIAGNDVRVYGAIAGRVKSVRLTSDGHARVEFSLREDAPRPHTNATAAIRPVDLLGENYLALDPGRADVPQSDDIPVSRTSNTARLDDVLSTFAPNVRDGLRMLLVEGGVALDDRGPDLARVSAALTPAIRAAGSVASELAGQNVAIARVVAAAERTGGQLARNERRLGPLVESLDHVLQTTGARASATSAALRGAPRLLSEVTSTARAVAQTSRAAQPVAQSLAASARPLAPVVERAPGLLDRARASAATVAPTLSAFRTLLVRGAPTLRALSSAMPAVNAAAGPVDELLAKLEPAAPLISRGFFDDFADQAAEPGKQPFDPYADPRRAYWRGAAVFSCESFGIPVRPGCLTDFLSSSKGGGSKTRKPVSVRLPAVKPPAVKLPAVKLPDTKLPQLQVPALHTPTPTPGEQRLLDFLLGK